MRRWDEVDEQGGFSPLPAGTRNFDVTSAKAIIRDRDQKRAVVLGLSSSEGSGFHEISLEPWGTDPKSIEQYENMMRTWLGRLGFKPEGNPTLVQAAEQFSLRCQSVVGAVIELYVKHEITTKDGKDYTNAKAYINALVRPAPVREQAPAAPAAPLGDALGVPLDEDPFGVPVSAYEQSYDPALAVV